MNECRCKYCRWMKEVPLPSKMVFECRRYAPRRIHGVGTGETDQKWPYVELGEWCGEFKPKSTAN